MGRKTFRKGAGGGGLGGGNQEGELVIRGWCSTPLSRSLHADRVRAEISLSFVQVKTRSSAVVSEASIERRKVLEKERWSPHDG